MITGNTPQQHWRPLTTLGIHRGRVTIENPLTGTRLSASADGLLDMLVGPATNATGSPLAQALADRGLLRSASDGEPDDQPEITPVMEDWISKGWRPSLEYLLWSERARFVDWDDADDSVRNAVVARAGKANGQTAPARSAPPPGETVDLGVPVLPETPVGEILLGRRTHRFFDASPMPLSDLASVLGTGLHSVRSSRARAARVGGAEGVLETHGVAFDFHLVNYGVDGVAPGVWTVDLDAFRLGKVADGDYRQSMVETMCGMPAAFTAAATLVFVADFRQLQHRYRHERALRSLYVEAGQIAQLIIMAAEALGYGCLITPATNDRKLATLLRLPGERFAPVYTVTFGHKARKPGAWPTDKHADQD